MAMINHSRMESSNKPDPINVPANMLGKRPIIRINKKVCKRIEEMPANKQRASSGKRGKEKRNRIARYFFSKNLLYFL